MAEYKMVIEIVADYSILPYTKIDVAQY